ncbi:MAG: hypothetical protein EBS49_07535, partial [Verrucomicrobia bacterium]|nr:hypothetical protein [Verrucomicrobiota bacterium]
QARDLLPAGSSVTIRIPASAPRHVEPEPIPLDVLYEDADVIVLNKPPGLAVHPGAGRPTGSLAAALLHHCSGQLAPGGGPERPGIVHRLDLETSGILVAAKTDNAHRELRPPAFWSPPKRTTPTANSAASSRIAKPGKPTSPLCWDAPRARSAPGKARSAATPFTARKWPCAPEAAPPALTGKSSAPGPAPPCWN